MILQVWRYKNAVPGIVNVYNNNSKKSLSEILSTVSVATFVPIVAASYFLEEIVGSSEELTEIRNRLIKFYGYTSVEIEKPND